MEKCPSYRGVRLTIVGITEEPLKTDIPRDKYKCPSYRGVRLMEVISNRNHLFGQWKVSVLERCPSYGMSVLRGFTVCDFILRLSRRLKKSLLIDVLWHPRCQVFDMSRFLHLRKIRYCIFLILNFPLDFKVFICLVLRLDKSFHFRYQNQMFMQ